MTEITNNIFLDAKDIFEANNSEKTKILKIYDNINVVDTALLDNIHIILKSIYLKNNHNHENFINKLGDPQYTIFLKILHSRLILNQNG